MRCFVYIHECRFVRLSIDVWYVSLSFDDPISLSVDIMYSLGPQNAARLGRHAVHAPIGIAVLVANGDTEATVVGPDHGHDVVVAVASDVESLAFALVGRAVLHAVGSLA